MKHYLKSGIAFLVIFVLCAAVCMVAGLAVATLWTCQAGVCVFFFGTLMLMLALGAFD